MPYRRLPNTDKARLKALNFAFSRGKELPPFKLAFSQRSNQRLQCFLQKYEQAAAYYRHTQAIQAKRSNEYLSCQKKARMYISHFIQVLNMAIVRGELKADVKSYFSLPVKGSKLPQFNSDDDIIELGKNLIEGEARRILEGGSPVTNPTIAIVRVRYEAFLEVRHNQRTLQRNTARALEQLTILRKEADDIILNIWNEVEASFKDLPDDLRREKAKEYGLVYVYRKNEISTLNFFLRQKTGAG